MRRNTLLIFVASLLAACAGGPSVMIDDRLLQPDDGYSIGGDFANPSERLACRMDAKCTKPLMRSQQRAERERLRSQDAPDDAEPVDPIVLRRDASIPDASAPTDCRPPRDCERL